MKQLKHPSATCTNPGECQGYEIVTDYNEVMLVGGEAEAWLDDVEIFSYDATETCTKPTPYPTASRGLVGTYANGKPLVCGGDPVTRDCFAYDFDSGVWHLQASMEEMRSFSSAVMLNDSHWWITGGINASQVLRSTELFNVNDNTFTPFVDLPIETSDHIVLKLDASRVFFCCGYELLGKSYIFDLETETWTETPQSQFDHYLGFAGKFKAVMVFFKEINTGKNDIRESLPAR